MQRTRNAFAERTTPFGTLIQTRSLKKKGGGCISLPFLHPMAMLWVCCEDCPEFKAFFSSTIQGQRLKIVMYSDEVTPSRELLAYNHKKLWAVYWSFLDFGPSVLCSEDAWFSGVFVRSHIVRNNIAGGMGQVFKVYSNMFFSTDDGFDFRLGVRLNVVPAGSARAPAGSAQGMSLVHADLAMVVQDADAHKIVFSWMGATSIKICPLCLNVVSKHCNLVRDPTGCTIPVYTTDTSRFRMCTNKTFRAIQDRLEDVALNRPTELKDKEQDLGFKYNPDGWLQDPDLDVKPMQVLVFDWMHCWCEGGVWALELGSCTDLLSRHGLGSLQLHHYLQCFKWPKAYASGHDICKGSVQERSKKEEKRPAGSASEMLSAGPVIRKWLEDVVKPTGVCLAQVTSLLLAVVVMDLLVNANTGKVTPAMLADAIAEHYAAHLVAYGYTLFVPKHHFMLHIPRQLERFKFLIACFVHERKHKVVKRWAVQLCTGNNRNYERSLLEECTMAHVNSLKNPLLKPCLLEHVRRWWLHCSHMVFHRLNQP